MAVLAVVSTALAAGNVLLHLSGHSAVADAVTSGMDVAGRVAKLTQGRREAKQRQQRIQDALDSKDLTDADEGDVAAADEAVARVLASAPTDEKLQAAVRDAASLHELLAPIAAVEESKLLNDSAQAAFRLILAAAEHYLVTTTCASPEFAKLVHQQELQDLRSIAEGLEMLRDRLAAVPPDVVQAMAGPVLRLNPEVVPSAVPIAPSRLLAPTSGVIPFVDRGGLLQQLLDWADDPAEFSVRVVGGPGGTGKSRLAVELCRALQRRPGESWKAGFFAPDPADAKVERRALSLWPGPRLVVLDYAETRTQDVAQVLSELAQSPLDWLTPIRVMLLVRNPTVDLTGQVQLDEPHRWVDAVRSNRDEVAEQLLDQAPVTLLGNDPLTLDERTDLFRQAIDRFAGWVDATSAQVSTSLDFLQQREFEQPLTVAMAAFLQASGDQPDRSPAHLFEGMLTHEARYWRRHADDDQIRLNLPTPNLRTLVAVSTVTDVLDDAEAGRLLSHLDIVSDAVLRDAARRFLNELYPTADARWGPLLPDRLGEHLVAAELTTREAVLRAVLDPARDLAQWVRPLRTLSRAALDRNDLQAALTPIFADNLQEWSSRLYERASHRNPDSEDVA